MAFGIDIKVYIYSMTIGEITNQIYPYTYSLYGQLETGYPLVAKEPLIRLSK